MTLQTDLETAVAGVQVDSQKLKNIVNGPADGPGSMVPTDSGEVKTVSRAIAEVGELSGHALRDLTNVEDEDFAAKAAAAGVDGVKVSDDDTTPGYMETKLLASGLAGFSTQNPGGEETRTIEVPVASQAQAEEGTNNATAMTPLRVAQAVAAIDGSDQVARDLAIAAYIKADILASDPAGVYGDIVSDNFTADALATQINATYNAAGNFYQNDHGAPISQVSGTAIGNMTGGGGLAAIFDGATSQAQAVAGIATPVTACYAGKDWGAGNTRVIGRFIAYGTSDIGFNSPGRTLTIRLQGSDDDVTWTDLYSGTVEDDAGVVETVDSGIDTGTAYRYHRVWVQFDGQPRTYSLAELELFELGSPLNMTLRPSATALPMADPLDLSMYFRVRDIDTVVEGVDRVIRASIDGGATWATATISEVGAYGSSDKLIRADADVSAQTGSSFVWELTTANASEQQIKQVASVPGY